jgi:two-component system heavy metal sensor histidine kinase CusS
MKRRHALKLRDRLSLTVTAVTAAALVASFAAVFLFVRRDETRDLDFALAVQARAIAQLALAKDPSHPTVVDGTAEVPESLGPTARYVAVYDVLDGTVESSTRSFGGETPSLGALSVAPPLPWEGQPMNLVVHRAPLRGVIVPMGDRRHALLYAASRRTVDEDTSFLYRLLTAIFLVATVATAAVARVLGNRLAGDVDAIANVARSVAQGKLDARVGGAVQGSAETRTLAVDLDRMIERLAALVAAQRTFISHAAHELRSPIATIRGELQLALRRPREAVEYRESIEGVLADVEALARLAEDLLTLARVEAGASPEQRGTIGEAVAEALRMARGPAEARGVTLHDSEVTPGASATGIAGPRGEIARVLRNLIDNAVAHSPERGKVEVAIDRSGPTVQVVVTDGGPGVPAGDAPHIFAPFFRGSKDRGGDELGAGLGLAIARSIAQRHGGEVRLDGSYASGARFVLEMPIDADG